MTALLEVPQNSPPTLAEARARFAKAAQEWDDCREMDNSPIRQKIGAELFDARDALRLIEALQIRKMKSEL